MITKEIALTLHYGQTLYHKTLRNSDGSALRARVNGKVKTWVRRPDAFSIPMKRGLRECFYIDPGTYYLDALPDKWLTYDITEEAREKERVEKRKAQLRKKFNLVDDTPDYILHDRMIDEGMEEKLSEIVCR